jgi:hypothetical protein
MLSKDDFLAAAAAQYDKLQTLNELTNFYDFEKEFVDLFQQFARTTLEQTLSDPASPAYKKKDDDPSGGLADG